MEWFPDAFALEYLSDAGVILSLISFKTFWRVSSDTPGRLLIAKDTAVTEMPNISAISLFLDSHPVDLFSVKNVNRKIWLGKLSKMNKNGYNNCCKGSLVVLKST